MITFAKRGDLHARRQVLRFIPDKGVVHKLFDTLAARYAERQGGYTRVLKLPKYRVGDAAPMAIIELVDAEVAVKTSKEKNKS
jgi:large subunit ribosomal protein L17